MSKGFKRKPKARPLKKTYLIVCEGACEEIYFKGMKRSEQLKNISVNIINPSISSPFEIFRHAQKELKEKEYDAVFCVIDGDVITGSGEVGKKFSSGKITTIISRPCFELWFLLHHKYTDREFHNCGELISKELLKHIPDYEKSKNYHSKKSFYVLLKPLLGTAGLNARKLESANYKNKKPNGSSTDVYKLLEELLEKG
ncbi:MAG: RloB domain-containing protein [bacterium]|nr:RloB domain-containing protein [bacterium]